MAKCTECNKQGAEYFKSDGRRICQKCGYDKYEPCTTCGNFFPKGTINQAEAKCNSCLKDEE